MPKTTPQISKLIVHDGVFHADDVLCAAMARSLNPDVWIQRTRRLDPMDIELNGCGSARGRSKIRRLRIAV